MRRALIFGVFAVLLVAPGSAAAHPRAPFWVVGQDPGLEYYAVSAGEHVTLAGRFGEVDRLPTKVTIALAGRPDALGEADVGADGRWTLPIEVPADLQSKAQYRVVQQPNVDVGGYELESIWFGVDMAVLHLPPHASVPPPSPPGSQAQPVSQRAPADVGAQSPATPGAQPRGHAPAALVPTRIRRHERTAVPVARQRASVGETPAPRTTGSARSAIPAKTARSAPNGSTGPGPVLGSGGLPGPHGPGSLPVSPAPSDATGPSARAARPDAQSGFALALGALLLMGGACAAAIVILRRRPDAEDAGSLISPEPAPPAPDAVEAELQEIISEEHAREQSPVAGG